MTKGSFVKNLLNRNLKQIIHKNFMEIFDN